MNGNFGKELPQGVYDLNTPQIKVIVESTVVENIIKYI